MAGTDFLSLFSSASLTAFKPDSWGILGHKPTMSDVAKTELLGILFKFSILLMKSFESLQLLLCKLISTVYRIHKLFQKNVLCRLKALNSFSLNMMKYVNLLKQSANGF